MWLTLNWRGRGGEGRGAYQSVRRYSRNTDSYYGWKTEIVKLSLLFDVQGLARLFSLCRLSVCFHRSTVKQKILAHLAQLIWTLSIFQCEEERASKDSDQFEYRHDSRLDRGYSFWWVIIFSCEWFILLSLHSLYVQQRHLEVRSVWFYRPEVFVIILFLTSLCPPTSNAHFQSVI